jgi:hypothetical protein
MTSYDDWYPSNYLKADDVIDNAMVLTISSIQPEKMQDGKQKPVVFFKEEKRGLVLNVTNKNFLVMLTRSKNPADAVGQRVSLVRSRPNIRASRAWPCACAGQPPARQVCNHSRSRPSPDRRSAVVRPARRPSPKRWTTTFHTRFDPCQPPRRPARCPPPFARSSASRFSRRTWTANGSARWRRSSGCSRAPAWRPCAQAVGSRRSEEFLNSLLERAGRFEVVHLSPKQKRWVEDPVLKAKGASA